MTEDIYKPSFHNDVSNFMSVYKIFIQYLLVSSEIHLVKYLFFFILFFKKNVNIYFNIWNNLDHVRSNLKYYKAK